MTYTTIQLRSHSIFKALQSLACVCVNASTITSENVDLWQISCSFWIIRYVCVCGGGGGMEKPGELRALPQNASVEYL